jgi:hypothetical protein
VEREAERIVAENIEAWGWGPLDEIEGLSEHVLAVKAVKAGLLARPTDPGEDKVEAVDPSTVSYELQKGWHAFTVAKHAGADDFDALSAAIAAMGHTPPSGEDEELVERLREALRPFARHVGKSGEKVTLSIGKDTWTATLTTDDFERARTALQRIGGR